MYFVLGRYTLACRYKVDLIRINQYKHKVDMRNGDDANEKTIHQILGLAMHP